MTGLRWTEADLARHHGRMVGFAGRVLAPRLRVPGFDPRMNRTEAAYALELEARRVAGELLEWAYEDTRLRLGSSAWFKPDFRVVLASGATEFHEIKGHWREAARVRIKVAAEKFRHYRFIALTRRRQKDGGGWNIEEFA